MHKLSTSFLKDLHAVKSIGVAFFFATLLCIATEGWADQQRASQFQYYDNTNIPSTFGLLKSETVEPLAITTSTDAHNACLKTEYSYDGYGNKISTTTQSCNGAAIPGTSSSADVAFSSVTSSIGMDANAQFAVSSTNAKNQSETYNAIDPRFGIALSQTGPNGLTTTVTLDEFGRKTAQTAYDGSRVETKTFSCLTTGSQGYDSTDTNTYTADTLGNVTLCALANYTHPDTSIAVVVADYSETQSYGPGAAGAYGGVTRVYHDTLGREIAVVKSGLDGLGEAAFYMRTLKAYDTKGRPAYTSLPHKITTAGSITGSTLRWSVTLFDLYGRPCRSYTPAPDANGMTPSESTSVCDGASNYGTSVNLITGKARAVQYDLSVIGKSTAKQIITTGTPVISTETKNGIDQLILKSDAYGNEIAYRYDEYGQLNGTLDGAGNETRITFDTRGRKTVQKDPDLGTWTYSYNALGQLINQTDAKGQTQSMLYDELGRLKQKNTDEMVAKFVYDCNRASALGDTSDYAGIGALCEESTSTGFIKTYSFDSKDKMGRLVHTRTVLGSGSGSRTYDIRQSFDAMGRLDTTTYPTQIKTKVEYSPNGTGIINVKRVDSGFNQVLWAAKATDSQFGSIQQSQLGNGLLTTEYRDVMGRLTSKMAGTLNEPQSVQNLSYGYTEQGDLGTRQNTVDQLTETYVHEISDMDTAKYV